MAERKMIEKQMGASKLGTMVVEASMGLLQSAIDGCNENPQNGSDAALDNALTGHRRYTDCRK